ncbi:hypothetical protein [Labrys wisconsinensis]|uniref:Uncharacterized protein n=1 Tax=Labrys wisconsinensis TaxID=425677 RepID=A0ABU0JGS6_9HYPH|nr:hypothetical protein [Labrys wisconsinensis]MDQ0473501.1 hypothetical protein [Labrys wisconsinensis]
MNTIFQSDRDFFVVSYDASHGLLLLRSAKTNEIPTRIDVLFNDVRAMEIRCFINNGLKIGIEDRKYLFNFQSNPLEMVEFSLKIYSLLGHGWKGFVIGNIFTTTEDTGHALERSSLLGPID